MHIFSACGRASQCPLKSGKHNHLPPVGFFPSFQLPGTRVEHLWGGLEKNLTNQDRTSDLEMINQLQSHALPTELW